MDLQTFFYIIAIIFMVMVISVFLMLGLLLFFLRKKLLSLITMAHKPAEAAADMGGQFMSAAIKKVDEFINNPARKSNRKR